MLEAEFAFKVDFLRAVVPAMTPQDLESFQAICQKSLEGSLSEEDLEKLQKLFEKFG